MNKLFRYLPLIVLFLMFSCTKEEETKVADKQPLSGFDYWLLSDEKWEFEYYLPTVPVEYFPERITKMHIDRDTIIEFEGDTIQGKILKSTYIYLGSQDTTPHSNELVIFFVKEKRSLYMYSPQSPPVHRLLANFSGDSLNQYCWKEDVVSIDTLKVQDHHFIRFHLSDGFEVVEGITPGLMNCMSFPPHFIVSGYPYGDQILRYFRYESQEYTYEWHK